MGLFGKLLGKEENKKPEAVSVSPEKDCLYLPVKGEVIALKEIDDGVFSEGVLGMGCGINPEDNLVYAPVSGTVSTVADTKHAVGIVSEDGAEILIHVGMDTVEMKGEGFTPFVKEGDKVTCGEAIMQFDPEAIKKAGFPTTTAFLVTNSTDFANVDVCNLGKQDVMSLCIQLQK